jgi:hypothetical protein
LIWLYVGAASLFVATVLILGYEWWAWRKGKAHFVGGPDAVVTEDLTISAIVRRWNRGNWKRRAVVFVAITIVALSIQFLAIHFVFAVG